MKHCLLGCTITMLFILKVATVYAQQLPAGQYKGLEKITVARDGAAYIPGVYNMKAISFPGDEKWYHEVTMSVSDSSLIIEKKPLRVKDNVISYSDSTGGLYYYRGAVKQVNDTTFRILATLDSCKYCPRGGTAVPRYTLITYLIHLNKGNWIVDTDFEQALLFRKQ